MNKLKRPKILPCPDCRSEGPGVSQGVRIPPAPPGRAVFRVDCYCGAHGPWAATVRRAIEVWNEEGGEGGEIKP